MEEFKMTEEISQNVEQAKTAGTATTMKTYYWSNEDVPFRVLRTADEITSNQYPIVVTAPDPNLKAPKYDWMKGEWYDVSEESYGQRLTAVTESLKTLLRSVE